jgi:uncharacterized protein YjaG (DUF416 family)
LVLLVRIRLQKAALVGDLSIFDFKAMEQSRAVKQVAEGHLTDLKTSRAIPQEAAIQPFRYRTLGDAFQRLNDLLLAGPQPYVHVTVGVAQLVFFFLLFAVNFSGPSGL